MLTTNTRRLNYLLDTLTAFRTLDELLAATATGYVPTIFPRTARHGELIRGLRSRGVRVWSGK